MKWWGWLVVGAAASLIFFGLLIMLEGLGVLKIGATNMNEVIAGGLIIIWSACIAVPLVLKAIKGTKDS